MPVYSLEIIVVGLGLMMLMVDAFGNLKDKRSLAYIGIIGLLVVLGLLSGAYWPAAGEAKSAFWNFYALEANDELSLFRGAKFYKAIALITTIVVLIMAIDYTPVLLAQTAEPEEGAHPQAGLGEFFCLPFFACAGMMWMASASNLVSIFVSLELVTVAFYVMVTYQRRNVGSLEAGVKYLILGALSTGFLVYGMAWLYGVTGSMDLAVIREKIASGNVNETGALFAFALILMAMAFKVGAVPFHNWIPDVYQGAPTPVTAFLAVGSKAAGFVVLMRISAIYFSSPTLSGKIALVFGIMAGLTLLIGNLVALPQTNFKRLLAYSSIANGGFLMMAMACVPLDSKKAQSMSVFDIVSFYLGAYLLMTLLAFLVMSAIRSRVSGETIDAYSGLAKRSPFLAVGMLVAMASLAGIPLTAGFFGKLFVFKLAFEQQHWWLLFIGVVGACAGFYYYLKVAAAMFLVQPVGAIVDSDEGMISVNPATGLAVIVLVVAIIACGINPGLIMSLIG